MIKTPRFFRALLCSTCSIVLLAACQQSEVPEPPAVREAVTEPAQQPSLPGQDWTVFVDGFIESHLAAHPQFAVAAGRHEYDGLLPDWSAEGIQAEIERLHAQREAALLFGADELGEVGQYQRDYLLAVTDRALFWLEKAEWPFVNPAFYFENRHSRFVSKTLLEIRRVSKYKSFNISRPYLNIPFKS